MARTSVQNQGSNLFQTSAEDLNRVATDILIDGVVGAVANTSGVAPSTGGLALNAQGSPNTTTAISAGIAYVTATPTSQGSQRLAVKIDAQNITHATNSSGATRYDWVYVKVDPTLAANPAVAGDTTGTIFVSRSTSNSVDNGTPPTYGYNIAIVTLANGFASVVNGNITDKRTQTGVNNASLASVGPTAIQTGAITLGYAQITSNFTTASTTDVLATGLTATVTVPTGGRRVKITVYSLGIDNLTTGQSVALTIWDGTVGSGTQIQQTNVLSATSGVSYPTTVVAVVTPSAGSKTYNVGFRASGGTGVIQAATVYPAFILVEAI